jgi:hypothetical protein
VQRATLPVAGTLQSAAISVNCTAAKSGSIRQATHADMQTCTCEVTCSVPHLRFACTTGPSNLCELLFMYTASQEHIQPAAHQSVHRGTWLAPDNASWDASDNQEKARASSAVRAY